MMVYTQITGNSTYFLVNYSNAPSGVSSNTSTVTMRVVEGDEKGTRCL
jgi:hypothetical protein